MEGALRAFFCFVFLIKEKGVPSGENPRQPHLVLHVARRCAGPCVERVLRAAAAAAAAAAVLVWPARGHADRGGGWHPRGPACPIVRLLLRLLLLLLLQLHLLQHLHELRLLLRLLRLR
jgi:hypothetical protein